jgi:hypothetical protein
LVNDELRVPLDIETLDPQLNDDVEAIDKVLILFYVVGDREVELDHVAHANPEGRDENEASTNASLH